jgi:Tol biopolymer transport system component
MPEEFRYLNQPKPGLIAKLFAPKLIDFPTGYHSPIIFTPEGEAFYSLMTPNPETKFIKFINGQWSSPQSVDFGIDNGIGDPFLSPDGKRLFFLTFKVLPSDPVERERIWFVDRVEGKWTTPTLLSESISAHPTHWSFSVAKNGNLYFLSELSGNQDIYVSQFFENQYKNPVPLCSSINTSSREFCPFIAPDESYILFSRVGRYLFFLSTRSGKSRIYWVSAEAPSKFLLGCAPLMPNVSMQIRHMT